MTVSPEEHKRRIKAYCECKSVEEMAERLNVSYITIYSYLRYNGFSLVGKTGVTEEEHRRRVEIYNRYNYDSEMARAAGLSPAAWSTWRTKAGLKNKLNYRVKLGSYVYRRPMWERKIMRHFLGTLLKFVDEQGEVPTKEGVSNYIETWIDIYGCRGGEFDDAEGRGA